MALRHLRYFVTIAESAHEQDNALKQGQIDVGFSYLEVDDAKDNLIDTILVRDEPLVAAIPVAHQLANQATIDLVDIVHERLLLFPKNSPSSMLDTILNYFAIELLQPTQVIEVRELHVALGLVAAGEGITIIPQGLENLQHQQVVYRHFNDRRITCPVVMKTRAFEHAPYVTTLLKILYDWYVQLNIDYYPPPPDLFH